MLIHKTNRPRSFYYDHSGESIKGIFNIRAIQKQGSLDGVVRIIKAEAVLEGNVYSGVQGICANFNKTDKGTFIRDSEKYFCGNWEDLRSNFSSDLLAKEVIKKAQKPTNPYLMDLGPKIFTDNQTKLIEWVFIYINRYVSECPLRFKEHEVPSIHEFSRLFEGFPQHLKDAVMEYGTYYELRRQFCLQKDKIKDQKRGLINRRKGQI